MTVWSPAQFNFILGSDFFQFLWERNQITSAKFLMFKTPAYPASTMRPSENSHLPYRPETTDHIFTPILAFVIDISMLLIMKILIIAQRKDNGKFFFSENFVLFNLDEDFFWGTLFADYHLTSSNPPCVQLSADPYATLNFGRQLFTTFFKTCQLKIIFFLQCWSLIFSGYYSRATRFHYASPHSLDDSHWRKLIKSKMSTTGINKKYILWQNFNFEVS